MMLLYRIPLSTCSTGFQLRQLPVGNKGVQFPRNLPGIAAWNSIREATFDIDEIQKFVTAFQHLVASSSRPQDLPEAVFLRFHAYVASAEPTVLTDEFIRRVEWATDLPNPRRLRAEIESLLLRQARAHIQEEAELLADVLIIHIFELLTQRGEKRLTVEELECCLRERSITELDRRILTRLLRFVEQAEAYLPFLASQMEFISQRVTPIPAIEQMLGGLMQQVSGIQAQFLPRQLPPPDEPPLRPTIFAKRAELVHGLHQQLSGVTWLNITGAAGQKMWLSTSCGIGQKWQRDKPWHFEPLTPSEEPLMRCRADVLQRCYPHALSGRGTRCPSKRWSATRSDQYGWSLLRIIP
jgi:hypothetical protein